ncbi:MAG: class I SAM-dependent methyltransferase [Deltaproteobacteria bacterium]|nr:class I SAM-dependent methyltransferase [Deltaproteobacteria bacterium]
MDALSPAVFSARRMPDRIHFRMVRCNRCGLVRSDPIAPPQILNHLYAQSTFEYGEEADNLKRSYGRYLKKLEKYSLRKGALLEIGCGNGFFLEEALRQKYGSITGVEPSVDAANRAGANIRPWIVCDIMRPGLFPENRFDTICMFQVLDHIPDPRLLLDECMRVLRPGGLVLCINHNIDAVSAKILGERSPVVDIEHTYLYSPKTLPRLFSAAGFTVLETEPAWNTYSPLYLARLLPMPGPIKNGLLRLLRTWPFRSMRVTVPLGNICLIAGKSERNHAGVT